MADETFDLMIIQIMAILRHYGFELKGYTPIELIHQWQHKYSTQWIRLAVIEAIYQGRYKSLSVEQILQQWLRRGKPSLHFNREFERLICHKLPQIPENLAFNTYSPSLSHQATENEDLSNCDILDLNTDELETPNLLPIAPEKKTELTSHKTQGICQFTPQIDYSPSYAKLREAVYKGIADAQNKSEN